MRRLTPQHPPGRCVYRSVEREHFVLRFSCAVRPVLGWAGPGCMLAVMSFAGTSARNDLQFLGCTRSATRHPPSEKFQLDSRLATAGPPNTCFSVQAFELRLFRPVIRRSSRGRLQIQPSPCSAHQIVRIDLGQSVLAANETLNQTENYHARKVKGGFVSDDWLHRHLQARDLDF